MTVSPYINQFIQPDTVIPDQSNPQSWNRYSYVQNNPLRYTDPTGHMLDQGDGGGYGSIDCEKYPQYCDDTTLEGNSSLIGTSSSYSVPNNPDFVQNAHEGTCWNCGMEPELPLTGNGSNSTAAAAALALASDAGTGYLSSLALNSQDIPVYVTTIPNSDGSVSVPSLLVDNKVNLSIAVMQVSFYVSGDQASGCLTSSPCLINGPYAYNVNPQVGIVSANIKAPGIGAIAQPHSLQRVSLVPSGNPNNPYNTFNREFTIKVILGNGETGSLFLPISVTIQP